MIQITYSWKQKKHITLTRTLGIGYHCGNTNLGQSDLLTITEEELSNETGELLFASILFTSGHWYRQLKYLHKKYTLKTFFISLYRKHWDFPRNWRPYEWRKEDMTKTYWDGK
jgi:hypothetical protein